MLVFINCEKNNTDSEQNYTIKKLNHKQVIINTKVENKINTIKNSLNSNSNKTIHSDIYNFSINTDEIAYIENNNGYHSYNFYLIRDSLQDNKLENLVLTLNDIGEYDAFIIKYGFSIEEFENFTENELEWTTTEMTLIEFDTSVFTDNELSNKIVMIEGTLYDCDENWHFPDSFAYVTWDNCESVFGTGGGDGGGNPPNNTEGNTTGNTGGEYTYTTNIHSTVVTTPYSPPAPEAWEEVRNCLSGGITADESFANPDYTPEMNTWLQEHAHTESVNALNEYLSLNSCDDDLQNFINNIINNIVNDEELDDNIDGICTSSFEFTDTGLNWQSAGIKDFTNMFFTCCEVIKIVNIHFPELYIGFPKNSVLVGGMLTNNNARYEAQLIFTQAGALTNVYQSLNPNSEAIELRDHFLLS